MATAQLAVDHLLDVGAVQSVQVTGDVMCPVDKAGSNRPGEDQAAGMNHDRMLDTSWLRATGLALAAVVWICTDPATRLVSAQNAPPAPVAEDTATTPELPTGDASAPHGSPPPLNESLDEDPLLDLDLESLSQPSPEFSVDMAVFYNDDDSLPVIQAGGFNAGPPPVLAFFSANGMTAETYGFELSANWEISDCWRLWGNYSFLQMQLHADPGAVGTPESAEGNSPHHQIYLHSEWDLTPTLEFDLIGRYIDNLPTAGMSSYIALDTRLAWQATPEMEVAVIARNLLDSHHPEFSGATATQVDRGVYGMVTLEW